MKWFSQQATNCSKRNYHKIASSRLQRCEQWCRSTRHYHLAHSWLWFLTPPSQSQPPSPIVVGASQCLIECPFCLQSTCTFHCFLLWRRLFEAKAIGTNDATLSHDRSDTQPPYGHAGPTSPPYYTITVSFTHLRAHEIVLDFVCRLLLEKKKTNSHTTMPTTQIYYIYLSYKTLYTVTLPTATITPTLTPL